ncbi:MAG: MarR family transcriptional regulator [Candidatus Woesearchaeota archaeon]
MNITQRMLIGTIAIILVFIGFMSIIFGISVSNVNAVESLFLDSQRSLDSFETLLELINTDGLLIEDFLAIDDYQTALLFSQDFSQQTFIGQNMSVRINQEIQAERLRNEQIILQYSVIVDFLSDLTLARDELVQIHLEELRTNRDLTIQKISVYSQYQQISSMISSNILDSIRQLNAKNQDLQETLLSQSRQLYLWIGFLLIAFFLVSVFSVQKLIQLIAKPIDDMASALKKFTNSEYTARVKETSSIKEIRELQEEMNAVFSVINEEISQNVEKKVNVDQKLLPAQLKEIVEYIQKQNCEQKITTMKDIKKQFYLTYPTVQNRIQQLEERGLLVVRKEGRDKQLFLQQ